MTEGTISYLVGCHQFVIHPLCVLIAWKKEYGSWPKLWEICCIFLHDIGHLGKQYLSDPAQKADHWILGARIAGQLFGVKGRAMVAGHASNSGYPRSKMSRPDKASWLVAPIWWLTTNYWVEDFDSDAAEPRAWKALVAENLNSERPIDSHELYLKNK